MKEVLLAFGILVVVTICLHVLLFTKWKKKSERFWKFTDYLWLGVGVLGLWGIAEKFEEQEISRQIRQTEMDLEREYAAQQSRILTHMNNNLWVAVVTMESNPGKNFNLGSDVQKNISSHYRYITL